MSVLMPAMGLGEINQHGYVVSDAGKAAMQYFELVGAGPFYMGDFTLDNYRYRGKERECRLRIAVGYWGTIQIEFIQPLSAEGTLYPDALPQCDGLLNHFAMPVADIDSWLAQRNLADRVLQSGEMRQSGVKFVYLENVFPGGLHLELVQAPEAMLGMYAALAAARAKWDRCNPLRPMAAIQDDLAAAGSLGT
jgi:Glyoxalase/Bleomycin resistance protein/Dioxygenase superfamily